MRQERRKQASCARITRDVGLPQAASLSTGPNAACAPTLAVTFLRPIKSHTHKERADFLPVFFVVFVEHSCFPPSSHARDRRYWWAAGRALTARAAAIPSISGFATASNRRCA